MDYSYHNIGISLVYPSHTPYNVDTPKIQVTKLVAGDTVNIYTDSNCTTSTGSPYTVGSSVSGLHTSNQIPVTAISTEGNHTFYVKVTDSQGHTSSGSGVCYDSQTIPYEYDTTDPNLTNISFTRTNPTNEEGPRFYPWFKISGVPEMSEVSLWTSNDCQSGRMSNFINVGGNDHTATTDVDISTYKLNTQREWTFWVKVKERAQNTSCSSISIPYYRTPDYYGHWHPSHVRLSSSNSGGMSNNRTPQFKIDNWNYGRFIQGDTAYVYSDSNCSNLLAETTTLTESYRAVLNIPSISTDGQHEFYFRVKDSRGNLSNCPSSPQETYRLDTVAPAEPTSDDVTFVGFSSSPNIYHQPTIRIGGLSGYNSNSDYYYARVYKDNQCTQSVSGSYGGSSGASHIDISLYALNEGTTDFYIRVYDRSGNWSNCPSSPQISYEYIKDPENSDISFIDPSSSPSTDTTPTVRIGGLGTSEVIKVYNASGCSSSNLVGTSSSSTSSGQVDITLSALNQGVNSLYFTKTKGSATTACPSSAQASYTVIPPTPTGVSLSSPTSSPGLDKNPSLTVAGITPGHTAYLYTGSNCANLVGNTTLASGSSDSSVIITSSDLATGAHTFYAKAKNPQGYYSACSSASVSYEVLAEAEITSGITSTSQISIYESNSALYGPQNAIDGDTSTYSHSDQDTTSDTKHWFTVDFGLDQQISKIKIYNRTDCCKSRLRDIDVTIHNSSGTVVYQYSLATFGNGYLNPNNVYNGTDYSPQNSGNSIHLGPDIITLNLLSSIPNGAGAPVTGSKITITRNLDPNYVANYTNWPAERNNLTISELKVYGIANVTPSVPSGLAISSPTTSTGLEQNIVLTVSGVSQGDTVKVFSDSSCSQSNLKGSGTASSSNTASVNVSNLTDGSYTFYATATNSNNNASACSSASVSYHKVSWNNFGSQSWTTIWNAAETSILNTASLGASGAATITKIGDTFSTSATKWAGGVLATNGKIYGIPWDEWKVLEIDPATGTASKMDHANITGGDKWMGGVLAPTGIIYGIPHSSSKILRIIPASGAVSTIDMTDSSTSAYLANATDTAKYSSGILAPNGKIYGIPYSATNVLVLNSITEAVSTISNTNDILTGTRKWKGGVVAPNGKIYCFPYDSENILVIDTSNDTLSTIDVTSTAGSANKKYGRGVMGPSGKIYVMPENSTHILVIDTTNDSVSTLGSNLSGTYSGGVFAPNGKIYSIPRTAENILEIDVTNQTVTTLLSGDSDLTLSNSMTIKWEGGILATNGKIYTIPYKADRVLEIDPKANGDFNSNIPLSPVFNKY